MIESIYHCHDYGRERDHRFHILKSGMNESWYATESSNQMNRNASQIDVNVSRRCHLNRNHEVGNMGHVQDVLPLDRLYGNTDRPGEQTEVRRDDPEFLMILMCPHRDHHGQISTVGTQSLRLCGWIISVPQSGSSTTM